MELRPGARDKLRLEPRCVFFFIYILYYFFVKLDYVWPRPPLPAYHDHHTTTDGHDHLRVFVTLRWSWPSVISMNTPTSRYDSLVVVGCRGLSRSQERPPTSHNDSLVAEVVSSTDREWAENNNLRVTKTRRWSWPSVVVWWSW